MFREIGSPCQPSQLKRSFTTISRKLSEKVYATIPKGIVGGFKFSFLQRNLQERHERPWT